MAEKINSIIFDFDGTLYDFKGLPVHLLLSHPADALTIASERLIRRKLAGQDFLTREIFFKNYISLLRERTGWSEEGLNNWYFQRYLPSMVTNLKKYYEAREGTNELFRFLLANNISYSVFSDYDFVPQRMRAIGISDECIAGCVKICSSIDFGTLKPSPRSFMEIVRMMNTTPEKCLVVGDRDDTDGDGARKCNLNFLQIKTHRTKVKDKNHPVMKWEDFLDYIKTVI